MAGGIKCPFCDEPCTLAVDSRYLETTNQTRRRRECVKCRKRFSTYEEIRTKSANRPNWARIGRKVRKSRGNKKWV